jgi:branched-chain amino acid transport system permease protein
VLMTALQISLSDYTGAWQLYVGVMFVVVVMFAPWGLGGLLLMHVPLAKGGAWRRVLPSYALVALPVAALFLGLVLLVETSHHLLVKAAEGPAMNVFGLRYDATSPVAWLAIAGLLVLGVLALRRVGPRVSDAFHGALAQSQSHTRAGQA